MSPLIHPSNLSEVKRGVDEASPLGRRRAGLLAPVFAMRHAEDFGVGDTRAVKEAIDFCAANDFAVLQILPIHETFGDHSPYNPISSRALSPVFVYLCPDEVPGLLQKDLDRAAPQGWLTELRRGIVKHGSVHPLKIHILQEAWHRFSRKGDEELKADFERFQEVQASWLTRYTLFRLLVREYEGNTEWLDWRPEHRSWISATEWLLQHPDRQELEDLRESYAYIQWVADRQWKSVREYADRKGILLMGEISFGVGRGSADVWGNPDLFDLTWNMGTRPLTHFDTNKDAAQWGQNWGLPAYRWENHRSSGYAWLRLRVEGEKQYFHLCRLDHLRGYFRAYMFPWPGGARHSEYSHLTPEEAALKTGGKLPRFVPGPDDDPTTARMNELQGRELIGVIMEAAGAMQFVAELMGEMPEYMSRALTELPLANLVFPQLEIHQPPQEVELRELGLATYANHDNAPLATLYYHLQKEAAADPGSRSAVVLKWLLEFVGWDQEPPAELTGDLLTNFQRALFNTRSRLAVLMCSDLFGIPLRFNLPGSYGIETWCHRLEHTFPEYMKHAGYTERLETVRKIISESERA